MPYSPLCSVEKRPKVWPGAALQFLPSLASSSAQVPAEGLRGDRLPRGAALLADPHLRPRDPAGHERPAHCAATTHAEIESHFG